MPLNKETKPNFLEDLKELAIKCSFQDRIWVIFVELGALYKL